MAGKIDPSMEKPTECKCPKCGKLHYQTMYWTGTCKPRKYCRKCKNLKLFRDGLDGFDTEE